MHLPERIAELDQDGLSWEQTHRRIWTAEEKKRFGDRIPEEGLGDEFTYRLRGTQTLDVKYRQGVYPTSRFRNFQQLIFRFDQAKNPTHGFAGTPGFEGMDLNSEKMKFTMGLYENPLHVDTEFQNLGSLLKKAPSSLIELTPHGTEVIQAIIAGSRRLIEAVGLPEKDNKTLERMITSIRGQFEQDQLHLNYWQY
ncbi:MAG: hypothetical protein WC651_01610 [Candidatus Gracilibacteria bacterium]|jgi:hypothetical protein